MRALFTTALLCACATKDAPNDKAAPSGAKSVTARPASAGPTASVSASAAAPSFDKLTVTVDGAPVKIQQALIKRIPLAGRYQLLINDSVTQCDQLLDNLFDGKSVGENHLLLDIGQHLFADGTLAPVVTYSYGPGSMEQQKGTKVKITGKADKGEKVEVTLDMVELADKKKREVHGSFIAEGCGERAETDRSGMPKAKHPSAASITIAGKKLPIVGAIRTGRDPKARDLVLSSGPKDCSSTTPWAEIVLDQRGGIWHVTGQWLERELSNSMTPDENTKDMKVTAGAKGTSDDGPTVELKLEGKGKIDDFPIAIEGTVEAIECPE